MEVCSGVIDEEVVEVDWIRVFPPETDADWKKAKVGEALDLSNSSDLIQFKINMFSNDDGSDGPVLKKLEYVKPL